MCPCYEVRVSGDREQAIQAIVESARQARPRTSRAMWIAGLVAGIVCIAAFVVIMFVESSASTPPVSTAAPRDSSFGFASGLAIGLGAGIAIGFAIARQRSGAHAAGDHSSRKMP